MIFFFNDTATTEIYTLSLHDALPISNPKGVLFKLGTLQEGMLLVGPSPYGLADPGQNTALSLAVLESRSEEHTSELQSQSNLVCRLLLEKKQSTELHYTAFAAAAIAS